MEFSFSDIRIIRSRRRRTCALIVCPDGTVLMRVPFAFSIHSAKQLVSSRMGWITRKRLLALREEERRKAISEGVPYLGEVYKITFPEGSSEGLSFDGREFRLGGLLRGKAAGVFGSWYRRRAAEVIAGRLEHYSARSGLFHSGFCLSGALRRWGACGRNGRLRFNWRLVMAPLPALDYVVAHELAHLRRRDHSRIFWKEVGAIMPAYPEGKQWLKTNGRTLFFELNGIGHSA
ncbi:MAG: M48 family metallopeptidase [Elusimicrobia bacterium]|nr:M48 family metallopeptidase [Elusimicrobiota bacterium]